MSTTNQFEDHIQSRPFQFSAVPQPRTPGGSVAEVPLAARAGPPRSTRRTAPLDVNPGLNSVYANTSSMPPTPASAASIGTGGAGDKSSDGGAGASGSAASAPKGNRQQGASDFVKKLYKMLEEDQYNTIVTWGPKGDSFVVKDMNEFTKTVLPQHFKHSNFASFVRQLNKYDFHKVKNPEQNGDGTGENYWEFRHPNFSIDQKNSLENIRRKVTTQKKPDVSGNLGTPGGFAGGVGGSAADVELLKRQVAVLTQNQQQIEGHMETFTAQYYALMADLLGQHRSIAAQDAFTATTLQYIINLESRLQQLTNPTEPPTFPPSAEAQHLMATYSELSRRRYDQMTDTTRRAEALGLFVNGNLRRPESPLDGDTSSDYLQPDSFPYRLPQPPQQQPQYQQVTPQTAHPLQQPQHSYFATHNLRQNPADSPSNNSVESENQGTYTNIPELRLNRPDTIAASGIPPSLRHITNKSESTGMSYFPAPGAGPVRPSMAITPGAVMVTSVNQREDQSENLTPTSGLTAANTNQNKDPTYLAEGEDIAAFAAALKGGQTSHAVRSALTAQPLIVRRATYIPGWSASPRVLLVEDDPVCRNLTTKFLQLFGCTIDVAADGVEAVNKMQSGAYDICMMDISMPNLDGVSATSLIRQFDAMTPIISMTGNSRPDEVLTYFSHGMNDVLPKPFTKEGMLSMLEKHLIHLKQIHQNPEIAPAPSLLDTFDPQTFDPTSGDNPFLGLGVSNEEYQSILAGATGNGRTTRSPSTSAAAGTQPIALGKRASDAAQTDQDDSATKRTRFQEI